MSLVPSKYSDRPRGDNVNVSHQSSLVTDQITHGYIQLVVTGSKYSIHEVSHDWVPVLNRYWNQ